ncbi:potassium channel family protein [Virgibacillus halophilus]|uniref:Potassium channel family protein n=2 Tax=Tigheibacillus halophilus TaxID=361280 RepID=A0ABU5C9T9_9BACI|nr:potassium channel family protein [Virgibacillus halophilus]
MTIGYGDITPVGIGRLVALIEALVGYVLPAAFVMRIVQNNQRDRQE